MKNRTTNNAQVIEIPRENLEPMQNVAQQTAQTNEAPQRDSNHSIQDNAIMPIAADNIKISAAELITAWGGKWSDLFECNDSVLGNLRYLKVNISLWAAIPPLAQYLTSRGYTSDKLAWAGVNPQDIIDAADATKYIEENIICPDALKIYEKFNTQIPQRPLEFQYTATTTNPTTKVKTIVRSTKIKLSINIVKQISEYLSPIEADAIFGIDIICNIKPQDFKGVDSEWLKLLNSDRAQNLALTPASILTPDYNSTASSFKENLEKLKTIFNLDNNPIKSICDALEANNSQQLEPLLEIALKTTYFVESDSACLTNARYKKIVKNSNTLKTLLKNNASAEEIREHLEQPKDIAINIADDDGNTILHDLKVVPNKDRTVEKLDILIKHGVDINAQNTIGETFAHYAAKLGPDEYIEILTDHVDFNFTLKNFYGETPLHYFVESRVDSLDENVVKFLTQPQQQLPFVVAENSIIAKKAVAKGYQVDTEKDKNGFTAIDRLYYDYEARMDLEDALLETTVQEFDGNRWQSKYFNEKIYGYADKQGNIRLHRLAAKGANAYLIYRIIEDSKDYINAKNNKNETPLHVAINKENAVYDGSNIITLVCSGADLFQKDNKGKNPLDLLNKWSEESLTKLFNTNAPIKSILIKAINEFKKQNPDNPYKFLEQALANSWDHYEYNEYYMYSDSDGYYDRTENYDDVEAHNGYNPCYFSKSFNFMENPAEVSDSEGNDAEEGELEVSELEDHDAEEGGLEGSELEDNHDERNQILGKRFCALDNNSESAANKRQKTAYNNHTSVLHSKDELLDDHSINQESNLELKGLVDSSSEEF